jgi:hypothetical protein
MAVIRTGCPANSSSVWRKEFSVDAPEIFKSSAQTVSVVEASISLAVNAWRNSSFPNF